MKKELNCKNCNGKCNKKGFPSVSKHSVYCDCQRKKINRLHVLAIKDNRLHGIKKIFGFVRGFR